MLKHKLHHHLCWSFLPQQNHPPIKKTRAEDKYCTLPETNGLPLKIDPWNLGDSGLGNHHFWGLCRAMLVSGRVSCFFGQFFSPIFCQLRWGLGSFLWRHRAVCWCSIGTGWTLDGIWGTWKVGGQDEKSSLDGLKNLLLSFKMMLPSLCSSSLKSP